MARRNPIEAVTDTVVDAAKKVVDVVTPDAAKGRAKDATERVRGAIPPTSPSQVEAAGSRARGAAQRAADAAGDVAREAGETARRTAQRAAGAVSRTATTAKRATAKKTTAKRATAKRATAKETTGKEATRKKATTTTSDLPSGKPYEQWTKAELYERAQELDIEGRSTMDKGQLIRALRDAT